MKTDIQIAQEAKLEHISEVAKKLAISEDDLEFFGKYKAKLGMNCGIRLRPAPMESLYW